MTDSVVIPHNFPEIIDGLRIPPPEPLLNGDVLLNKILSASFCTVCGAMRAFRTMEDSPCPGAHMSVVELWLVPYGLSIQRWFLDIFSSLRSVPPPGGPLSGPALDLSNAERLRIIKCGVASQLCEMSLSFCAGFVQEIARALEVVKVEEVMIGVQDLVGRSWNHSIFRINFRSGEVWVFDPTGIQFGPHWATVERWDRYQARYGAQVLLVQPLGTQAREDFGTG